MQLHVIHDQGPLAPFDALPACRHVADLAAKPTWERRHQAEPSVHGAHSLVRVSVELLELRERAQEASALVVLEAACGLLLETFEVLDFRAFQDDVFDAVEVVAAGFPCDFLHLPNVYSQCLAPVNAQRLYPCCQSFDKTGPLAEVGGVVRQVGEDLHDAVVIGLNFPILIPDPVRDADVNICV